jgi:hypothetical protein
VPRHSAPQQLTKLRPRLIVTLVVAAAGLTTAVWLPTRNDSADASERNRSRDTQNQPRQQTTAFADEFGGQRGEAVDFRKWAGGENTRNARIDGAGNLVLTARRSSSPRLVTRESFVPAYGHVEARIKTSVGEGLTPTLSLVGSKAGELNLIAAPLPGDFHTYALAWTPDKIVSLVDGRAVNTTEVDERAFDQTFSLVLTLGAGQRSDLPARMVVDFVRLTTAGEPSATPSEAPTSEAPTTPPSEEPTTPPSEEPTAEPTTAPTTVPPTTTPPTTPPTSAPAATAWAPFTDYVAGQLVTYEGAEYQVQETHTSLPGWEPTALPSLFKKL